MSASALTQIIIPIDNSGAQNGRKKQPDPQNIAGIAHQQRCDVPIPSDASGGGR